MGKRGEGWFAIQMLLFVAILLSPLVESFPFPLWLRVLGLIILAAGGFLTLFGIFGLGQNITPFPRPKEGGQLVTTGAYSLVRHPIYSGAIIGAFGWALLTATLLGLVLAVVLFGFFDLKSRREERWLVETYPTYPEYQQRVKKLLPWVY